MVKGMIAIWNNIACIVPNSKGGISRLAQYRLAPDGTLSSCSCNLIKKKWPHIINVATAWAIATRSNLRSAYMRAARRNMQDDVV